MEKGFSSGVLLACLLALLLHFPVHGRHGSKSKISDGLESWGYVEVRPKAHMFWWLYKSPYRVEDPKKPWPIVLWLQGGPGASGVGIGNFKEVGPLDVNLKPRNSTWLKAADLLFVDNPVATGFSYVDEFKALAKTDEQAGEDIAALLINLFNGDPDLQKRPLYIVAESYGGKFAVTTALAALKAIEEGKLKLTLGGVALGDSWISPEDYIASWAPLLKDVSRMDENGVRRANKYVKRIKGQLKRGHYSDATNSWAYLQGEIGKSSNKVDFYNFMLDEDMDPIEGAAAAAAAVSSATATGGRGLSERVAFGRYGSSLALRGNGGAGNLTALMNGPIRKKLKIIPKGKIWSEQSDRVFDPFQGDFMKPRIAEVDELLAKGVNVTIYNGQVDLICATTGTEAWVHKLKWDGLPSFLNSKRTPLYCEKEGKHTRGFKKSFNNLHFYWILGAGHFVPVDQPCVALNMLANITNSPAKL